MLKESELPTVRRGVEGTRAYTQLIWPSVGVIIVTNKGGVGTQQQQSVLDSSACFGVKGCSFFLSFLFFSSVFLVFHSLPVPVLFGGERARIFQKDQTI